jgi:hypothetical protein
MEISIVVNIKMEDLMGLDHMNGNQKEHYIKVILKMA